MTLDQMTAGQAELLQAIAANQEFKVIVEAIMDHEKQGLYQALQSAVMGNDLNLAAQIAGKIQTIDLFWIVLTNAARQSQKLTNPK